jgi:CheY-like chemotaxis protein
MNRKRILLVDDSETVLAMEQMILGQGEFDLVVAHDGDEAVATARALLPDLILMDIVMPKMNGLAACRELKQSATTSSIPIIIVTTRGEPEVIEAAYASGCSDFITKPMNGSELLAKVRDLLGTPQTAVPGAVNA